MDLTKGNSHAGRAAAWYSVCDGGFRFVVGNLESGGVFMLHERLQRVGNVRWGLIAALLGLPLPIVLLALLFMGGCGN